MKAEKLNAFLTEYSKKNLFSGAIRITQRDEIIFQQFYGMADFEQNIPFEENTVFSLYSISKPFCAIGFLKLYDQGLIDLDCHPAEYLPEMQPFDKQLKIRHLLHHVSGLPDFRRSEGFAEKYRHGPYEKLREQLKIIADYPMFFTPGSGKKYENINYIILAQIIENISGLPYAKYMQQEVFEPLGMKQAKIDRKGLEIPRRAQGYCLRGQERAPIERASDWMFGAGDIAATMDDVYCLNRAIKNQLLLKPETWQQVLTPSPLNQMGMGCTITDWHGKKRITHNGGSAGFRTLHIQLPEDDFDIILLSNSGFGEARQEISEEIHRIYYGEPAHPSKAIEMDRGYI